MNLPTWLDAAKITQPRACIALSWSENCAFSLNSPLCLRFWTHMYGSGIGSLNVYVRQGSKDAKVWGLSGDAGNNWYMAQAPIASSSPFRVRVVSMRSTIYH